MDLEFKINGGPELMKALETLPLKMEQNIMRAALRVAAKTLADDAKARVPVRLGVLRDSIKARASLKRGKPKATVKAGGKKAWYAHIVERGAKPHMIKASKRMSLFIAGIYGEVAHHPGAHAKPFLRPALDEAGPRAIEAAGDYIRARLVKAGALNAPDDQDDPETGN